MDWRIGVLYVLCFFLGYQGIGWIEARVSKKFRGYLTHKIAADFGRAVMTLIIQHANDARGNDKSEEPVEFTLSVVIDEKGKIIVK